VSNLAFYSTYGFEVIGHRRIGGGGPDVWAMLREPVFGSGRFPAALHQSHIVGPAIPDLPA
jgi:hypothetical protein